MKPAPTLFPFSVVYIMYKSFNLLIDMKTILRYLLLLPLIAVTSCLRETFEDIGPCPCDDEKSVVLKLGLPSVAPQGPATRSIGADQENAIVTVDVLAFKVEGGVETFQYWTEAKETASLSYSAKLRVKDYQQRLVLVANARSKVETLIGSRLDRWVDADKEAMLAQLTIDLKGSDRWDVRDAANYTPIPFWGETAPKTIDASTNSISDAPIQMLRMLAKIEVQLDPGIAGLTDAFQLQSVHVFNTNTSGRIVPKTGAEYIKDMVAQKASLPDPVTTVVGPAAYTDFNLPGMENIAMRGAIYLFETAAKNAGNFLEETCIVVGGHYDGGAEMSYYRLDFFNHEDGKTHLDILRNHRYICNIVEVKGPGEPTVEEAFRAKSFNMKADIIPWNEGVIPNVIIEGQYMLAVSHDHFVLNGGEHDKFGADNILKIVTDYPTGWTADVYADKEGTNTSTWLTIDPTSGAAGLQPTEVHLLTDANTGDERTAYIHIKAGRITYIVTVVQEKELSVKISVAPGSIVLPYQIEKNGLYSVYVTSTKANGSSDPDAAWELTSDNTSWLKLSLSKDADFGSASDFVSGKGNLTVYLYATNNDVPDSRMTFIYLGKSVDDRVVDVFQYGNIKNITGGEGAGTPVNARTYVGAFWRANETGERLIRIEAGNSTATDGAWTASVMWTDPRWSKSEILLDTERLSESELTARGISFNEDMTPQSPEYYLVTNTAPEVSGNATASNRYIFFRIGLKSEYTPTAAHPARYAVVLLSYNNNTKYQKIFLRQGEEPDYLMMNGDAFHPQSDLKSPYNIRTNSSKFAVYNLTANTLNEQVGKRGAIFTQYPTQAGALWQWGTNPSNGDLIRMAYSPIPESSSLIWPGYVNSTQFWNTLMEDNEVSPDGYRRPTDGRIHLNEDFPKGSFAAIMQSEMRQSLFWTIRNGTNHVSNTQNSVWGYYADGFFDRRMIQHGAGYYDSYYANTTVARDQEHEIAHIGRLFFNPIEDSDRYNASLFFPAAGWVVTPNTGDPTFSVNWGCDASYWSSSASHSARGNEGLALRIMDTWALPFTHPKSALASIRPVADEQ